MNRECERAGQSKVVSASEFPRVLHAVRDVGSRATTQEPVGTKGSYNLVAGVSDLRVPGMQRLYMEPLAVFGSYPDHFLFVGQNNPGFEGQRAGANDSDEDNYVEATQWDNRVEIKFRYLLPMGHAADDASIVNRYVVQEGLLMSGASGGKTWNALASGRTPAV